ncbi:hypothetical protein [Streptomyces sp. NPDC050388]|uniref:hypothetical protein n=1 Tax=Streptomyces sp. NPDC050388 TaxID=3155781 RepID=UPI0034148A96
MVIDQRLEVKRPTGSAQLRASSAYGRITACRREAACDKAIAVGDPSKSGCSQTSLPAL